QFPFEADVAARFSVLDERAQRDLFERLRLEVLLEKAATPEGALPAVIAAGTDRNFGAAVEEMIGKRDALIPWIERAGGLEAAVAELSAMLGIAPGESLEEIERAMVEGPVLPPAQWLPVAELLAAGTRADCERAKHLRAADETTGAARLQAYLSVFFTDRNEPRDKVATRAFELNHPDVAQRLAAEQARLAPLASKRCAIIARDRTEAALVIAVAVVRRYRREKERRGLLDYDDLIDKALTLLSEVEAAWVHYKLDLGIDHVLIDEAQDTSPKQWAIVQKLVAEFTAGEGVRSPQARSIFAVGDEKQSIFSFQGAAPEKFAEMLRYFAARHRDAELEFRPRRFQFSFRSGETVLGAVDAVFAPPAVFAGVTSDHHGMPPHVALPGAAPGLVEIWPLTEAEKRPEI